MTQGDHVRALKGGVWDHAIDVGDRTVIRFARGAGLERCGYADFVAGADRVEVVVHRERVYGPPLVVDRAFSRFAESAYGKMFLSPEQFAVWCKSGWLPAEALPAEAPPAAAPPSAGRRAATPEPARRKPGLSARRAAGKAAARRAASRRSRPAPRKGAKVSGRRGSGAPGKASPRRRAARRGKRR